ncbi:MULTISPECIES: hypothetical protein [Chryseobacterium]|uniref:Uncharacterized protein n=1 Tax=Chryseobacterium indologenes TaxID=253 RepID=A0AAD0YVL9_CHRID|nr:MULTISPECIES: hypothetical protein [Chryseobacterium]ASE61950.1 hypothetical protein CEQ15_10845 [Chryseobacterium indologenes]ATN05892.1 hypothetical protein CRN76_11020 [Chryseobacterium indologenes]AYY85348.1 hypothetical protein EGX91_12720 [Chryseobacterium indologenes]AZB17781.1 hypothetical protein EG352_08345 [Chryseobacterium indologenes]QIX82245.1 hypothetical protein FOB56_13785 [Chryseobacterium indologenes]
MKKYYSIVLLWGLSLGAQVGINTPIPNSTLAVNGSLGANYKQVTTNTYSILANDHYLTYSGTGDATFTLPVIGTGTASYTGRIYKIKNISTSNITLQASSGNTLRIDNTPVSSFVIPLGAYAEVVNNSNATGGTWDLSFTVLPKPSNVEIYGSQLSIPPHGNGSPGVADWTNHTNTSYDTGTGTDIWWVISKSSTTYAHTASYSNASRMTIIYEYQGTPFNVNNMYPILTAGNNSSFPDVFTASFVSLANNGTAGRTRLTVSVSRIDFIGTNGGNNSNWTGTFLLNLLLARKY